MSQSRGISQTHRKSQPQSPSLPEPRGQGVWHGRRGWQQSAEASHAGTQVNKPGTDARAHAHAHSHTRPPVKRSIFKECLLRAAATGFGNPLHDPTWAAAPRPLPEAPGLASDSPADPSRPPNSTCGSNRRTPRFHKRPPTRPRASEPSPDPSERWSNYLARTRPSHAPGPQLTIDRDPGPSQGHRHPPPARPARGRPPSPVRRSLTGPFRRPPGLDMSPAAGAAGAAAAGLRAGRRGGGDGEARRPSHHSGRGWGPSSRRRGRGGRRVPDVPSVVAMSRGGSGTPSSPLLPLLLPRPGPHNKAAAAAGRAAARQQPRPCPPPRSARPGSRRDRPAG